ncbi:MAG: hypothetical protein U1F57_07235 [bacterium]
MSIRRCILSKFFFLFTLFSLCACGGQDGALGLVDNPSSPPTGLPQTPSPSNPNHDPSGGCVVQFSSNIVLKAKLAPGASSSADATGLIVSEPKSFPAIPLHFNGNQVVMNGDEFQEGELVLGSHTLRVRQKAGTQASGTYDAPTGSILLQGVQFEVTSPLSINLPTFSLTSGSTGDIPGNFGNLIAQGSPLSSADKGLTLAGGFVIASFPLAEFVGAAVTVDFEGSVDSVPDPAHCSGGGGSGVVLTEIVTDSNHQTTEVNLSVNAPVDFGRVFAPQAGTDFPGPADARFRQFKTLKVKNSSAAPFDAQVSQTPGFTVTPSGTVNIPAGASQEFKVEFGVTPVADYSESQVPLSRTVNGTITVAGASIALTGVVKRAAPELSVQGTESHAPNTVEFGVTPVKVLGSGASTTLDCRPASPPVPTLSRKILLANTGIRPLQISHILPPTDNVPQKGDPYCANYGSEFLRMALGTQGGAVCQTLSIGGKTYLTDACTIPPGDGRVTFQAVYLPMNASSIRNATDGALQEDSATLTVESNDPRYDGSSGHDSYQLNLHGAVSADQSDVLTVKKEGANSEVPSGGNLRVNIPNAADISVTQKLVLLNHLNQPLTNVQIAVGDTAHFQVMTSPSLPPTTIPAMDSGVGAEPGKGAFFLKFTKDASGDVGSHPTSLTVSFVPGGSGPASTFTVNLTGTVNHQPITGEAQVTVEMIGSYIDTPLLGTSPNDSLDFRKPENAHFTPGAMRLQFVPVPGAESLRSVTILNPPGFEPDNPNLLTTLMNASRADRAKLIRLYSTRLSGYPGGVEDANHDGTPDCTDPDFININYVPGDCSFFYYMFAMKPGNTGTYDDETGEMVLPDLNMRLLNPFHAQVLDYQSNQITNAPLRASISTHTIDARFVGDLPLVPDSTIQNSEFAIPDTVYQSLFTAPPYGCPGGVNWKPEDPVTPTFGCYLTSSSPHRVKGMALTPLPDGDYRLILTLLTRFPDLGAPANMPSFMARGKMWVSIQGRLHVCGAEGCH